MANLILQKLFTSKNRIRIIGYLLFDTDETYIRELSRELGVAVSAVKKEVDNLVFLGIINVKRNRIVLNKKCNFLEDLRNIFIKTDFVMHPIKRALKNSKIKYAFMFGSFARGDFESESDIDLLVLGSVSLGAIIKILKPVENKIKRDINPVVWTIDNLKKEKKSGFVKDIFKKGIVMIKGDEDELRKIIK